ncbi:MAG TPA: DoxX family membrane protein [Saprospiraceae bacterium]|nr:DoxX family membrane protein [Saprospiraceae bacterium]HNT18945.1 DoxX family membrane protein [Saprospiraceae bacterium]
MIKSFTTGSFPAGLVLVRVITGFLLIRVGWEITSVDKMSGYFQWLTDIRFPLPVPMAYAGKIAELAGGVSFITGFLVRWTSIPVMITMAVITFIMGEGNLMSDSFLLLLLAWVFFCTGAGKWSLDGFLPGLRPGKPIMAKSQILFFPALFFSLNAITGQPVEPWIHKPFDQWPEIALVNRFSLKDGSGYDDPSLSYAGTAFLVRKDDAVFAVTVKHILFLAWRKFNNRVFISDKIGRWTMHLKNNPGLRLAAGPLLNEDPDEKIQDGFENGVLQRDWLIFKTDSIPEKIHPLTIGSHLPSLGDKVYLTGNPYRIDHTVHFRGKVVKQEGPVFLVQFEMPDTVFLGGASGSPVLDENGHLVGIFSTSRRDPASGRIQYIMNTTHYLHAVLENNKPLNLNRRPLATLVDSLVRKHSVKTAMDQVKKMYRDPDAYFRYNLSWPDYKALDQTGRRLILSGRTREANRYYRGLLDQYPGMHFFVLSMLDILVHAGKKEKALRFLEQAIQKADPETRTILEKKRNELTC